MDNITLKIRDFKCFHDATFELRNLTILTGANATGKSTVVQSLLLLDQVADSHALGVQTISFSASEYGVDLGDFGDLINISHIETADGFSYEFGRSRVSFSGDTKKMNVATYHIEEDETIAQLFQNELLYLSAERIGPRYESALSPLFKDEADCGMNGENTASVISANYMTAVNQKRWFNPENAGLFSIQLDAWIDYIFPGITVRISPESLRTCQVLMRSHTTQNKEVTAPNIGFGITYVLPIIVEALLISDDGWLVIENPEVHLHAKAQSNLGYFLGVIAASGVRVVLETHSEHIVDGVRRALVCRGCLKPEDVAIYFMEAKKEESTDIDVTCIEMDEDGNLSDSPVDFFDQVRQDMMEIISTVRARKA